PAELHAGCTMQAEKGSERGRTIVAQPFYSRPYPAKATIANHLDCLGQRLPPIRERADDTDAVEKVVGRHGRAAPCTRTLGKNQRDHGKRNAPTGEGAHYCEAALLR